MLYGDFPLDFNPLASVRRTIERLHRARADQELRVLLARRIRDKTLNTAKRKTVWLRDGIVICLGGREKDGECEHVLWSFHIDSIIFLVAFLVRRKGR